MPFVTYSSLGMLVIWGSPMLMAIWAWRMTELAERPSLYRKATKAIKVGSEAGNGANATAAQKSVYLFSPDLYVRCVDLASPATNNS